MYLGCKMRGAELASATVPWYCLFFAPQLCYENLPQKYDTLKYLSQKLRGLEVALVDFSPDWCPWDAPRSYLGRWTVLMCTT